MALKQNDTRIGYEVSKETKAKAQALAKKAELTLSAWARQELIKSIKMAETQQNVTAE